MNGSFYLAGADPVQLALVCGVAFTISILSGLSGYGAGLVIPVFLTPVVGIANVIPVMAISMLMNTGSRAIAFRRDIRWDHARYILLLGLPACIAGAWGYTLLSSRWIALLLGLFLLASIPLRRLMNHLEVRISRNAERGAGLAFGFVNGGMAGTGIILISILMSAGVQGAPLIATDSIISTLLAVTKIGVFSGRAALNADLAAVGLLVGLCTAPGGFIARRLLQHIPMKIHTWVMEVVVVFGGVTFLWHAWR